MCCSPDGKFLASVGSGGPARVWDVSSSMPVAALQKEKVRNYSFVLAQRIIQGKGSLHSGKSEWLFASYLLSIWLVSRFVKSS